LAKYFNFVNGVDISEEMIKRAKEDNQDLKNVKFNVSNGIDLKLFPDNYFNFCFSFIVFQHIPRKDIIINYFKEIRRILKIGSYARLQVRGYPGKLPHGLFSWRYKGFNLFYLAISKKKNIPFPAIKKYNSLLGAFFKPAELRRIFKKIGYRDIKITQEKDNLKYLWVSGKK